LLWRGTKILRPVGKTPMGSVVKTVAPEVTGQIYIRVHVQLFGDNEARKQI